MMETPNDQMGGGQKKTSTGLDENIAGLLAYLLSFVTGIIFLIIEKENSFVRFHAFQSVFLFGGLFVISIGLSLVPFIGWLLSALISPIAFVLWIVCMYKAYQGERFKLPIVGDIAEKQMKG